jgi:hypothetical protein
MNGPASFLPPEPLQRAAEATVSDLLRIIADPRAAQQRLQELSAAVAKTRDQVEADQRAGVEAADRQIEDRRRHKPPPVQGGSGGLMNRRGLSHGRRGPRPKGTQTTVIYPGDRRL